MRAPQRYLTRRTNKGTDIGTAPSDAMILKGRSISAVLGTLSCRALAGTKNLSSTIIV